MGTDELRETCGRDCHGTEEFYGFCGCIRCLDCLHWLKKCDTPELCEWRDERDEWTDGEVERY